MGGSPIYIWAASAFNWQFELTKTFCMEMSCCLDSLIQEKNFCVQIDLWFYPHLWSQTVGSDLNIWSVFYSLLWIKYSLNIAINIALRHMHTCILSFCYLHFLIVSLTPLSPLELRLYVEYRKKAKCIYRETNTSYCQSCIITQNVWWGASKSKTVPLTIFSSHTQLQNKAWASTFQLEEQINQGSRSIWRQRVSEEKDWTTGHFYF